MTFSIPLPTRDAALDYETATLARNTRNAELLHNCRKEVLQAYEKYVGPGYVEAVALPLGGDTENALKGNYRLTYEGEALEDLRDDILASAPLGICPMCGRGDAQQVDHYLPKDKFPELSIYAPNLVPTCDSCNTNKRALVGNATTGRFLHAYLDALPTSLPLYKADIEVTDSVVAVFSVNPRLPAPMHRDALYHFAKLKLGEQFGTGAALELWVRSDLFSSSYDLGGPSAVAAEAHKQERLWMGKINIHHWTVALYAALKRDAEFCNGGFRNIRN